MGCVDVGGPEWRLGDFSFLSMSACCEKRLLYLAADSPNFLVWQYRINALELVLLPKVYFLYPDGMTDIEPQGLVAEGGGQTAFSGLRPGNGRPLGIEPLHLPLLLPLALGKEIR